MVIADRAKARRDGSSRVLLSGHIDIGSCNARVPSPVVSCTLLAEAPSRAWEGDMSDTLQYQIIREARALITNPSHWCRGHQGRDALGRPRLRMRSAHCAYGALLLCALAISGDAANCAAACRPCRRADYWHHRSNNGTHRNIQDQRLARTRCGPDDVRRSSRRRLISRLFCEFGVES